MTTPPPRKLAVILHADVVGSTALVQRNESVAHERIQDAFRRFSATVESYGGIAHEIRGDALVAEFARASDAVSAALAFQFANTAHNKGLTDDIRPEIRTGISLGEVVIADGTITGTGVVLAQRLEQLAAQGGVVVQGSVSETVPTRMPFEFEDLGAQQVKGFDQPVRAFAVRLKASAQVPAPESTGASKDRSVPTGDEAERPPLALPDKPSIAVLPFTNMSGDPEQEYFSDGITEDIITELSRFPELFVIARNSSFIFKGEAIDIKEAARKLGVQYIVEGSVRKAGNRVRVTAQLVDAVDGAHLWADRYDRQLEDIFEVQDDVVRAIVGVLPGRIAEAGAQWSRRKATSNLSAFDYLMRANHALNRRGDNLKKAIGLYQQAILLDPEFAAAYAGIAIAEGMSVWDLSYYDDNPLERAYENGKRAVELDSSDYRSHEAFGGALRQLGRHSLARQHLERAMVLNPNSARVLESWAMLLAYTGDLQGTVDTYHHAIRLDPFSQDYLRMETVAEAYYMMRKYEESLVVLESMLKLPIFYVHQQMAMCYAQLGDMKACEKSMAKYRESLPASYDEKLLFESHLRLCAREEDREHWVQGYRLIGMDV